MQLGLWVQEIVGNKEHDHSARWLASVHLKNSVSRNWKGRPDARCAESTCHAG